jgi:ComEC/Rec2-related protein
MFGSLSAVRVWRYSAVAFLLGVAVASLAPEQIWRQLWPWSLALSLVVVMVWLAPKNYRNYGYLMLALVAGWWRFGLDYGQSQAVVDIANGNYSGQAEIVESPRWVMSGQELIVRLLEAQPGALVSVKTGYNQSYQSGQKIWLSCRLRKTENNQTYLKARDLASACYQAEIVVLESSQSYLERIRIYLATKIKMVVEEPVAGLAIAMLFGQRQGLSPELLKDFSESGLSHLIAISGMNISLLVWLMMVSALAVGLARRQAYVLTVILISLFVVLVGAEASVVRAALMGILVISAPQLGRRVNFNHVLLISAALMMVYDPRWLMFDLGFQLSFLAIMGLVYFYPGLMCLMEGVLIKAPQRCQKIIRPVAVVLVATVAAQILTAPLLVWRFGYLSVASLPANVLSVWTMPIVMTFGLLATMLAMLWVPLGLVAWLPIKILLSYVIGVAEYLADRPWAIWQWSETWIKCWWLVYLPIWLLGKYLAKVLKNSDKNELL